MPQVYQKALRSFFFTTLVNSLSKLISSLHNSVNALNDTEVDI